MTAALGDFDQPMQLVVFEVGLNLKFYFNFFDVPFFIGSCAYRRFPDG